MKIALLVSGIYKNSTVVLSDFLSYLRNQPNIEVVDVYMHFWWDKKYIGKRYRIDHLSIVEDDPSNDIETHIKPVKYVLEPQVEFNLNGLPKACEAGGSSLQREIGYFSTLSQIESLQRCLKLIDNPERYDCIWRHRADLFIQDSNYIFNITDTMLKGSYIWIADGQFFTGWPYGDWSFLGNTVSMITFINNWGAHFRDYCKSIGKFPHIHLYFPRVIKYMSMEAIRWHIPINISRNSDKYKGYLIMDTVNSNLGLKPFFWDLMDKTRL